MLDSSKTERYWIALSGTLTDTNLTCTLINVYGPCCSIRRAEVWKEIINFCSQVVTPCLLLGDFNEVLGKEDRGSKMIDLHSSSEFHQFLHDLQVAEIPSSNGWFTWFRGESKSKIDRLFVHPEWLRIFPDLKVSILGRSVSDHTPLLVHSQNINWGPRPFRFQDCWLQHKGCLEIVKKAWLKSSDEPFMSRLKLIRNDLKVWNHEEFGDIEAHINRLEAEIKEWDEIANSRHLDQNEMEKRRLAQIDLWAWWRKKEIFWAQKSRAQWLKLGDRNTKFFHAFASIRKRKNTITFLRIKNREISEPEEIKAEAIRFFSSLFSEDNHDRPTFQNLGFNNITPSQSSMLTAPFSNQEIDNAVASCNSSKSPGPDGFNFKFIKAAWNLIKSEVYLTIEEFWKTGKLPKGSNVAFIALIAKTENPNDFKDFRPISMVGCIYKIISKLLANRLKSVMNELIGPYQSAFIEGRQILDGALIVGELLDSCKKNKTEAIILKLDFHKAFDSISWAFLDWVLSQMNFPSKWRTWISSCVTSAAASVLLNGTPTTPFKLHRGLRQGDPLSPFLFVLVVEAMNLLIKKATDLHLWSGIPISKNGPSLTHLQFADDTIVFCNPSIQSLTNIQNTLIIFQLASGLKVNFHKSAIYGINVDPSWLSEAAQKIHCKVGVLPLTYLGLPIGGCYSRLSLWDPIILKMEKRLASWKSRLLSIGGRITLLKASLSNLPLYFMSLFHIPQGVVNKITKIQRDFLWSSSAEKKGLPLVKWDILHLPKSHGGLNISNLQVRNQGLLFKWLWRFFIEKSALWRQIINVKYNYPCYLTMSDFAEIKRGGIWKNICNSLLRNPVSKTFIKSGTRRKIGNGASTMFLYDCWASENPLKVICPRLFHLSLNQTGYISQMGSWKNNEWVWDFSWARFLRPRDLEEWECLSQILL